MLTLKRMIPIYVLALLALMFVSCDEDTAEDWVDPLVGAVLAVSSNSVEVGADGETPSDAIEVTNSGNAAALRWEVASTTAWITFTSSSGATPSEFQVVAEPNTTGDARSGTATVTSLDLSQAALTITITQPTTGPAFCVTGEDWETLEWTADPDGEESSYIYLDNCGNADPLDWDASTDASWLTLSAASGTTLDSITITADPNDTGVERDTAYVVITEDGAEVSDTIVVTQDPIPPPMSLASLGYVTTDVTSDVFVMVEWGQLYAADGAGQVPIFDADGVVEDEVYAPFSDYPTAGDAQAIHMFKSSGSDYDYVYVAQGVDGVEIWWWGDDSLYTTVATTGPANDVYVRYGDTLYVAAGDDGLEIYDIADLDAVTLAGSFDTDGEALGVHVSGNYQVGSYAYVADGTDGLAIIDIGVGGSPALTGTFDNTSTNSTMTNGGICTGVDVVGQTAFVTEQETGLHIVNCTDAANPEEIGAFVIDDAQGVRVFGDYAFVAAGANGVYAIDISEPATPTLAGSFDTDGEAMAVYVYHGLAFVADGTGGIVVLELAL